MAYNPNNPPNLRNDALAAERWNRLHPGETPGLGVDIDEKLAAKYPYKRAYLPVNRLEDGTMTNW